MFVTVELGDRDVERLDQLKTAGECVTRSDALRLAIRTAHEKILPEKQPMGRNATESVGKIGSVENGGRE